MGVQASGGAAFSTTQLEIDPSANGDITLTPNGTGDLVVGSWGNGVVTSTAAGVSSSINGTDGQILVAATANPVAWADLTSSGGTIAISGGANTLNIETAATIAASYDTDSGTATPAGGVLDILGGTNINTAGAADAVTVNLDSAITVDQIDIDNIQIDGNTIISTDTNGDITLTPDGTGAVNISYLTQYTLPIAGASGAIDDLADGLGSSGQILTSNGAGAEPTWEDAPAGALTWSVVTGSTQAVAVNTGYFANYAGTLAFTLPATAAVGDTMRISQMAAGQGWSLAQNAGQTCFIGNQSTTTGAGGSLASTDDGDEIEIVCRVANTEFKVNVISGNITVV
ncbi:MAG: hypothetical protein R3230_01510 [Nitrosopumilaceae archaeon]|nr:hypothetical protein [Nitrosopumilaceae archaeon]